MSANLTELKAAIRSKPEYEVVSEYVLDRIPFVFGNDSRLYRNWKLELSSIIDIDPSNISITGSACVGFSLSPHKNFSKFSEDSDIDVAVISDFYFHMAWRSLRSARISDARTSSEADSLKAHRTLYVFHGCIATDKVLAHLTFKQNWTEAMSRMSAIKPTDDRDVKFRLYKDYESLRSYQAQGMMKLKQKLLEA